MPATGSGRVPEAERVEAGDPPSVRTEHPAARIGFRSAVGGPANQGLPGRLSNPHKASTVARRLDRDGRLLEVAQIRSGVQQHESSVLTANDPLVCGKRVAAQPVEPVDLPALGTHIAVPHGLSSPPGRGDVAEEPTDLANQDVALPDAHPVAELPGQQVDDGERAV